MADATSTTSTSAGITPPQASGTVLSSQVSATGDTQVSQALAGTATAIGASVGKVGASAANQTATLLDQHGQIIIPVAITLAIVIWFLSSRRGR